MTTRLEIINGATSNGDVHVRIKTGGPLGHVDARTLTPGQKTEAWINTGNEISIDETWPTNNPASQQAQTGERADQLIAAEVAIQDKMWGDANERADATNNQMLGAAMAQLGLLEGKLQGQSSEDAVLAAGAAFYPKSWDGFRDYGSNIANLVVAAAFIRSEIKRRLLLGEDTTRAKRGEPYRHAAPNMSSEDAAKL